MVFFKIRMHQNRFRPVRTAPDFLVEEEGNGERVFF